ncbi:hypothetical protein LTR37_012412 [Vermiconidia calcicola]|uniref:Uncharacterized protein n=1 Tax=Vermiconidia calcicola TaxID=1690605 RepID=A0ACC3N0P8_9PEZI|nr:hypothetical protein LTR37_012412 [Vermiconidia calcicola]
MLHEILLALSGHPSPLFEDGNLQQASKGITSGHQFPLLSPSERSLLRSIGELSELHRKLRNHIGQIASSHESTICRAVATAIQQVHLGRFQDKILAVEGKILTKDPSVVGAYDIVPLAGVVSEFEDWHRQMSWYWEMACFMQPIGMNSSNSSRSTGAALVDRLRSEQQTGFPDVEHAAIELNRVAETAWLRQLASWVLYGRLPAFGANDFCIRNSNSEAQASASFVKEKSLLPKFVSASTASSILFVGKSLNQVRRYGRQKKPSGPTTNQSISEGDLASVHLQQLTALSLPIVPAQLSRAISTIRLSLSRNVLQSLLPMQMILELLSCLKQFFLLERGEFAVTLISEADNRLHARQQSLGRLLQQDPVKALQGLSLKDAEFHQTLSQTWKTLAAQDEDVEDDIREFAQRHLTLSTPVDYDSRPSTSDSVYGAALSLSHIGFNDLLFPKAVSLGLDISPPLDLFISQKEIDVYASVNAYLLSLKRAHLRLSDLWRRTAARRDSSAARNISLLSLDARERMRKRRVTTRKFWATCSAATFLLSETTAYFEGEIARESWSHFEDWVKEPLLSDEPDISQTEASTSTSPAPSQRDPETLASGHRTFLASLTYALLLNDITYTKELRSLLGNVDSLIAFFNRLLEVQQKLDLERDASGETGYTLEEELRLSLELDRARKKVDSDLKSVVSRLRQLDQERIGSGRYLNASPGDSEFEPWKGGGVDRLLMKLEFGRMVEGGFDIV